MYLPTLKSLVLYHFVPLSSQKGVPFLRHMVCKSFNVSLILDGVVVAQLCNLLTLQPEKLGREGWIPGRAAPLEHHEKGPWTR